MILPFHFSSIMFPRKSFKFSITYLRPSFFLPHPNLATLANFWKSLTLSGAKIKISPFFSFFDQTEEWQKNQAYRDKTHINIALARHSVY